MSGVGIICFAASYTVALVLEISRLLFRSGVRGALMLGFAGAGLLAHSAYLYYRAIGATGSPLSSEHDWYMLAAWALVVVYLYLTYYHPKTAFGLFLLPVVLGLIATAAWFADRKPFPRAPASEAWGTIHGASIVLSTVAVSLGFVAGVMYLIQTRRLKRKVPPTSGLRLPSLEWLERTNSRAIVVSLLMLAVGVLSGMVLNRIGQAADTGTVPLSDPVVLSSLGLFLWLLAAVLFGAFHRQGRKVAWLTVASFVFLVIALAVMLALDTQHGGSRGSTASPAADGGRE